MYCVRRLDSSGLERRDLLRCGRWCGRRRTCCGRLDLSRVTGITKVCDGRCVREHVGHCGVLRAEIQHLGLELLSIVSYEAIC